MLYVPKLRRDDEITPPDSYYEDEEFLEEDEREGGYAGRNMSYSERHFPGNDDLPYPVLPPTIRRRQRDAD